MSLIVDIGAAVSANKYIVSMVYGKIWRVRYQPYSQGETRSNSASCARNLCLSLNFRRFALLVGAANSRDRVGGINQRNHANLIHSPEAIAGVTPSDLVDEAKVVELTLSILQVAPASKVCVNLGITGPKRRKRPPFGSLFQRCLDSGSGPKANVATRHHSRSGQGYR